jgi:hypothetical protein
MIHPHKISSSLSSRKSKRRRAPLKKKMMASFNDDQAPLKPTHSPQNRGSRIQMWVGCMLSLVALVTTGSIYKHEHSYHQLHPSEATLASVVPYSLIPMPVPISKVEFVIPVHLLAWQPVGDDYYYSVIPGLSWNTSSKAAATSKAVSAPASLPSITTAPLKKNNSQATIQFLKNPTVLVEVAAIVACHFLWMGPLPSLLTKLATSRRLRVMLTVARRVRIFKPFQKIWKGITTIYKNRSKLSVASEYTFYVEASPSASSAQEDKENLESSNSNPTRSNRINNSNRTKKITTVHSRNVTKQPTLAKLPQF